MKKLLLILLVGMFMFSFVSAEVNSYAPVKQSECVTIKQTCASCTYVNVSISYPNSTLAISNQGMSSQGAGVWTYDFCNTTQLGRYDVNGEGDLLGTSTSFSVLWFEVTPDGNQMNGWRITIELFASLSTLFFNGIIFVFIRTRN